MSRIGSTKVPPRPEVRKTGQGLPQPCHARRGQPLVRRDSPIRFLLFSVLACHRRELLERRASLSAFQLSQLGQTRGLSVSSPLPRLTPEATVRIGSETWDGDRAQGRPRKRVGDAFGLPSRPKMPEQRQTRISSERKHGSSRPQGVWKATTASAFAQAQVLLDGFVVTPEHPNGGTTCEYGIRAGSCPWLKAEARRLGVPSHQCAPRSASRRSTHPRLDPAQGVPCRTHVLAAALACAKPCVPARTGHNLISPYVLRSAVSRTRAVQMMDVRVSICMEAPLAYSRPSSRRRSHHGQITRWPLMDDAQLSLRASADKRPEIQ